MENLMESKTMENNGKFEIRKGSVQSHLSLMGGNKPRKEKKPRWARNVRWTNEKLYRTIIV